MGPKVVLTDGQTEGRTDGWTTGLRELDVIRFHDEYVDLSSAWASCKA